MMSAGILSKVKIAFIGAVVPDEPSFQNEGFSRAGNLFQTGLLRGLAQSGLTPSLVLATAPASSRSTKRWSFARSMTLSLANGQTVHYPACFKVTPLKQVTLGLAVLRRLLVWGWRNRKAGPLVVCTYNLSVPPGIFTLLAARLIRAKAVAVITDLNVPGETVPNSLWFRFDYKLHRWLMPRFDALAVAADALIKDFGLQVPYIRMEGAVSESQFSTVFPRNASPGFVIVAAGSLDEPNGIGVLLKAFSQLEGEHYKLRIAGSGPLLTTVKAAVALDSRIEYCGFLAWEEVLRLYASADVLINMRLTRCINTRYFFPSKCLEYLASGRPVISTCTGHVEEEFGQLMFLLREESPEALAAAIVQFESVSCEAREQMGAAARNYMMANKTWRAQGSRMAMLIESLVTA